MDSCAAIRSTREYSFSVRLWFVQVLGLPGANGQKWFVFHVSRPDESDDEAHSITVRTIVETSKVWPPD